MLGKAYILLATLVAFVLMSGMEAIPQNAQMPKLYFGQMINLGRIVPKNGMFALMDNFVVLDKFATYASLWRK